MKTSLPRVGKFKLVLFLTLCAVVLGCAIFLCFNIFNKHNTTTASADTVIEAPVWKSNNSTSLETAYSEGWQYGQGYYYIANYNADVMTASGYEDWTYNFSSTSSSTFVMIRGSITVNVPHTMTFTAKDGYSFPGGAKTSTLSFTATLSATRKKPSFNSTEYVDTISIPCAGTSGMFSLFNAISTAMSFSGLTNRGGNAFTLDGLTKDDAGTVKTVTFTLKDGFEWEDGTNDPVVLYFNITKMLNNSVSFTYGTNNTIDTSGATTNTYMPSLTGNFNGTSPQYTVENGTGAATIDASSGALTPTKPGTIRVTVTLPESDDYEEATRTMQITILGDISNIGFGEIADQPYNYGLAIEPKPVITDTTCGNVLTEGTDFDFSYTNNTAMGQATITVTGKGNYTGTKSTTFTIIGIDISNCTIGTIPNCTYNGLAQTPTATVTLDGTTLSSETDFTFSYKDNIAAGEATLTVTGNGNYSGKNSKTFKIEPRSISGATVADIPAQSYTGSVIEPLPRVTDLGRALTKDAEYTVTYEHNVEVGTATVTVTGKGNFEGTLTANFNIVADVNKVTVTGIEDEYEWTGTAITPEPVVTLSGVTLVKGTDYTVTYSDNTDIGTATVNITGKGAYNSVKTVTFDIVEADISAANITGLDKNYEYTGSAITPEFAVSLRGKNLVKDTDYTVVYRNNVNLGAAVVDITGIGKYKGTKSTAFTVIRANIARAQVTAINSAYEQTGSAIEPVPVVTVGGVNLVKGADYEITYTSNIDIGTATYTITGIGNYTGSISGTFKITIAQPKVEVVYVSYNGTDRLFVGKALPEIRAIATYDGAPVEGAVAWDTQDPTLKGGSNDYNWIFTPADLNKFSAVTGFKTLTGYQPEYVAIRAEWRGGVQPELFTSTPFSVLKQNLKVVGILSSTDTDEIVGGYSILGSWETSGLTNTVTMPVNGGNNFTITVSFGSWSDTLVEVEIKDVTVTEFTVETLTDGKTYTALDKFDPSTVKVTAKYNDGTEKEIPFGNRGYTVVYEKGGDGLQFGDTKVTVSFTDKGVTKTAEVDGFTVKKANPELNPSVGGSVSAGKSLSELILVAGGGAPEGTIVWDNAAYELQAGSNRCYYTFTPDDTENYNVVRGYVDVTATEASVQPVTPAEGAGGISTGWIIAIVIICLVIVIVAIIALMLALKLRKVTTTDDDGFYDATEDY